MRAVLLITTLALSGCETPEDAWVNRQYGRCNAMGATHHYDKTTKVFECWRHALARNPKLMFRETFRKS